VTAAATRVDPYLVLTLGLTSLIIIVIMFFWERYEWNGGYCRECENRWWVDRDERNPKWEFDKENNRARRYTCSFCDKSIKITNNNVDSREDR